MTQNAVVLGGSVAGLLAAAALSPRYTSIEIVERDLLSGGPRPRRGVPQGQHVHGLLPRGLQAIEELLPGFTDRLVAAGAYRGDVLGNARWYLNGRALRRTDAGLTATSASRALIEYVIRDSVRSLPNVRVTDGHDIVGLTPDRAVRIADRYRPGSRAIPADLIVDATGRGSRMPQWLLSLGYPPPDEDVVDIDVRYSSRVFGGDLLGDDLVVVTARYPGQRRSSVMQRLEGGRVLVTLAGVHGERPPADLEGFAEYAASLPVPDTAAVVEAGTPLGEAMSFHFPAYVRRRYERATLPPGIIVLGDAACAFNPVYGQGMSTAAISAATLRDDDDPQRFHARQAVLHEAPWALAVGADLALDAAPGGTPTGEAVAASGATVTPGAIIASGGAVTPGAVVSSGGAVVTPDAVVASGGAAVTPGAVLTSGGAAVTAERAAVAPDGAPVTPDGAAVTPDGAAVTPDRAAVAPDRAAVTPDGASAARAGGGDLIRQLQLAAAEDGELAAAFIRVTSLVDPPQALGAPWIVERLAARAAAPRRLM